MVKMKKRIKNVVAGLLSMGLLLTSVLPASANEINTIVLGNGSNSVRFVPGTYDLKVEMRKAGEEGSSSMAAGALKEEAVLTVHEDGTASVDVEMQETTIMGFAGVAATVLVHQEHNSTSETISATINSTMSFKAGTWGSTYTVPKEVTIDLPFDNQDGVYISFQIRYSLGTMDQTAYFLFDFTPYRADYTSFDSSVSHYESVKNQYTTSSCLAIEEFLATASYCEPVENQSAVDKMAEEFIRLMDNMELRNVEARESNISANIAVNEASYILEIPAEIGLGELSIEEDTAIPYDVSVEVLQGNNGTTTFQVSADTSGELTAGSRKLVYGNTLDNQTFTQSQTVEAYFIIAAETVAKAAAGNYEGEVFFTVSKVN